MPHVETLRGPVDTKDLGFTLMHEHVFVLSEGVTRKFPSVWDEEAEIASAREKLRDLHGAGVGTIVDLTVMGLGRDIPRVQRVAGDLSLNVIVATGLYAYTDDEVPRYFRNRDADVMAELFARDITRCSARSLGRTAVPARRSRRTRTSARSAGWTSSASSRRRASTWAAW